MAEVTLRFDRSLACAQACAVTSLEGPAARPVPRHRSVHV